MMDGWTLKTNAMTFLKDLKSLKKRYEYKTFKSLDDFRKDIESTDFRIYDEKQSKKYLHVFIWNVKRDKHSDWAQYEIYLVPQPDDSVFVYCIE